MYTSHVGAILVIAQLPRVKTSFVPKEKKSYTSENRYRYRKIDVMFGNVHPNPHIKAFSDIPNEDQQKFLDDVEFTDHICLYPSREFLTKIPDVERFKDTPFTYELALGAGQLDFRVFDLSVLEYYRNDPRYYYETDFINGSISIHDEYFEAGTMPERSSTATNIRFRL